MATGIEPIIERFGLLDDPAMKLDLLLGYSKKLPELPEPYRSQMAAGLNLIPECQSPAFLVTEIEDGRFRLHADAPREAPTARSFLSLLTQAYDGADPAEVARVPLDLLSRLGLADRLGMTRTRGLDAMLRRVQRAAAQPDAQS